MQHDQKQYVARTYRFKAKVYEDFKRCQQAMEPPPSETALVELAIREFVERRAEKIGMRR